MSAVPTLQVENLKTHFFTKAGVVKAVDGVDFAVLPGEIMGLVGESGSGKSISALSVLRLVDAATTSGARSLGRDDLGRLAVGARADIVVVDLSGRGTLRMGPVRDPVKALVECAVGDDVDTTIVAGVVRMRGGRIPGVDVDALRTRAQASAERIWANWQSSDALGRTADEMSPWSFCPSCRMEEAA